jgi:hypothetical protein
VPTTDELMVGGFVIEVPAKPYCDCVRPVWKGFTRRNDGRWVRPCCMRPTKQSVEKFGPTGPVPTTAEKEELERQRQIDDELLRTMSDADLDEAIARLSRDEGDQ